MRTSFSRTFKRFRCGRTYRFSGFTKGKRTTQFIFHGHKQDIAIVVLCNAFTVVFEGGSPGPDLSPAMAANWDALAMIRTVCVFWAGVSTNWASSCGYPRAADINGIYWRDGSQHY
ncbi:hypothetical protein CAP48_16070 [Advenella sp. S44]|nr:hypothetical protein CAP48_16070 [Advenella sp. S44]